MSEDGTEDIGDILNKWIDSQFFVSNDETDLEPGVNVDDDLAILQELLHSDRERTFSVLDLETTASVMRAAGYLPSDYKSQTAISASKKIQCSHCEEIFEQDFELHVCMFDENHVMIPIDEVPDSETDLQKLHCITLEILEKNQQKLSEINQKDRKAKSSNFECSKCCRKFVHESGLFRHWDKHIGELIDPSPEDLPDVSISVTLCNLCHEIFGVESDAWDHYVQRRHFEETGKKEEKSLRNSQNSEIKVKEEFAKSSKPDTSEQISDVTRRPTAQCTLRSVRVTKVFQCEFCDLIFFSGPAMMKHVATHDPANAFECNKCELNNLSLKEILLHRRDECVIFRDVRNPLKDFPRVWVCNTCEEVFRGLELLLEHRHTNHHYFPRITARTNKLLYSCEQCIVHFKTAPKLVDHYNEKHFKKLRPDAVAETSERIAKSPSTRRGGSHQTSTRARLYLCEVCGKSYTQSSHLWQHLRFHQGVKPFACSVDGCDRRFTIRPDLNDHIRKCHTGERPYLCTICGKRFLTGSVYYQHRLIHRGERRYGCEECGKRFYRADALKNHMRIHSGEKPHSCSECFRTFRQRGDRDKHVKARHPHALIVSTPRKNRVKSFGRGRVRNNISLYCAMPGDKPFFPEP